MSIFRVESEDDSVIEVDEATMRLLVAIARQLDCTVSAALEEAIREYALNV